jgi:hypothetical protein
MQGTGGFSGDYRDECFIPLQSSATVGLTTVCKVTITNTDEDHNARSAVKSSESIITKLACTVWK